MRSIKKNLGPRTVKLALSIYLKRIWWSISKRSWSLMISFVLLWRHLQYSYCVEIKHVIFSFLTHGLRIQFVLHFRLLERFKMILHASKFFGLSCGLHIGVQKFQLAVKSENWSLCICVLLTQTNHEIWILIFIHSFDY